MATVGSAGWAAAGRLASLVLGWFAWEEHAVAATIARTSIDAGRMFMNEPRMSVWLLWRVLPALPDLAIAVPTTRGKRLASRRLRLSWAPALRWGGAATARATGVAPPTTVLTTQNSAAAGACQPTIARARGIAAGGLGRPEAQCRQRTGHGSSGKVELGIQRILQAAHLALGQRRNAIGVEGARSDLRCVEVGNPIRVKGACSDLAGVEVRDAVRMERPRGDLRCVQIRNSVRMKRAA